MPALITVQGIPFALSLRAPCTHRKTSTTCRASPGPLEFDPPSRLLFSFFRLIRPRSAVAAKPRRVLALVCNEAAAVVAACCRTLRSAVPCVS